MDKDSKQKQIWSRYLWIGVTVLSSFLTSIAASNIAARGESQAGTVSITDEGLQPATITIPVGGEVTWTNETDSNAYFLDYRPYMVYLPFIAGDVGGKYVADMANQRPFVNSPHSCWNGSGIGSGQSCTQTFTQAGQFTYYLLGRPGMMGLVIVEQEDPPLFETVLTVNTPGGYAAAPDAPSLDLGVGDGEDFTIETFFYVPEAAVEDPYIDLLTRKDEAYALYISFNNDMLDWISFKLWTGAGDEVTLSHTTNLTSGWHHVAAVYDNEYSDLEDRLTILLDGQRVADSVEQNIHIDWTPGIPNSTKEVLVGGIPLGQAGFLGYIDEMRFSAGVRYGGPTYTVPSLPFVADDTTRTLWHFDEADGTTVFEDSADQSNTLTGHAGAETVSPTD